MGTVLPLRLAPLLLLVGCSTGDLLGPNLAVNLTTVGGCADVILFGVDDRDQLMLKVTAPPMVAYAQVTGEPVVAVYSLRPSFSVARVDVHVYQGSRVSDATCDDVIENGGPRVDRMWTAVKGSATLTARAEAGRSGATVDVLLEDVVLEAEDGEQHRLRRLEWHDIQVGWLPG